MDEAPTIVTDDAFLKAFEARRWPLEHWRHRDHIRLAYIYLTRLAFAEAADKVRTGIKAHNAAHGIVDAPAMGYHETVTMAWLTLVAAMLREYGPGEPGPTAALAFCDEHPELSQKKTLRLFYSRDLMMSPEAKARFVKPDLTPLP